MPDNSKAKATPAEIQEYVISGGVRCIFKNCLSQDIDTGPFQSEQVGAQQDVTCPDCGGTWTDMLTLSSVDQS